jgi:hypothetical protein
MTTPVSILLAISAFILIALGIREIILWYWKINKIVSLLESIKENTSKISESNQQKKSEVYNK